MKKPKICIFCGVRGSISKEHFWSEWLAPHIREANAKGNVTEFHSAEGLRPKTLQRRSERPGSVTTKKIRAVCERCNNGWMSAIESGVKPTVEALLKGNKTAISEAEAAALALWLTVKTVVAEHASRGTALTPMEDRSAMLSSRTIPKYFRVFLGRHTEPNSAAYVRHSTTVSLTMAGPKPPMPRDVQRNIQVVCFLVGTLAVCVTSARVEEFDLSIIDPPKNMLRLWPSPEPNLDLGTLERMNRDALAVAAGSLDRLIAAPNVRYGGPLPGQRDVI